MMILLMRFIVTLYNMLQQCPEPPTCCESGNYAFDECGCCLKCAKVSLLALSSIIIVVIIIVINILIIIFCLKCVKVYFTFNFES